MADKVVHKLEDKLEKIDKDELKKAFDTSHFDINAIVRGIQLTLVGGARAPGEARDKRQRELLT